MTDSYVTLHIIYYYIILQNETGKSFAKHITVKPVKLDNHS